MGTLVSITIVHPDGAEARAMAEKAFDEMERLEQVLSRHRSGTSLARLNERGSITDAPLELLEVVRHAIRYSELTGGAFDVTVTPVLELYRASFADSGASPGDAELREALSLVGYRGIKVAGSEIELDRPGMSLTLDGIAKGYVVDSVVRVLAGAGAQRVVVDAGGDMSSSPQTERSEPWRVAIQDPRETGTSVDVLRLRGESVATSGDYMQSFTQDRSVHHIIDPQDRVVSRLRSLGQRGDADRHGRRRSVDGRHGDGAGGRTPTPGRDGGSRGPDRHQGTGRPAYPRVQALHGGVCLATTQCDAGRSSLSPPIWARALPDHAH